MKAFFANIKIKISYFFKAHTAIAISLSGAVLLAAVVPVVIISLNRGNNQFENSSNITSICFSSSNSVSDTQKESSVFQSISSNKSSYLTSESTSVNSENSSSYTSSHSTSSKTLNSSSVTSHTQESHNSSSVSSVSSNIDETYTSSPDVTEDENFTDVRLGVWHIFKKSVSNEENYEAFYLSFKEDDENLGEYFSGYAPTLEPTEKLNDSALLEEYRENGNTETINNTEYYHWTGTPFIFDSYDIKNNIIILKATYPYNIQIKLEHISNNTLKVISVDDREDVNSNFPYLSEWLSSGDILIRKPQN